MSRAETAFAYGRFQAPDLDRPHLGARFGDRVLDLTRCAEQPDHGLDPAVADCFATGSLDALLAAGPDLWPAAHAAARVAGSAGSAGSLAGLARPIAEVDLLLPFTVADYVDFYASRHHATNVGRIFRPDGDPLTPNWDHLPIGYHGRAGTVVVSGTPIRRPRGQVRRPDGRIEVGPTERLDLEAEIGFVLGGASHLGDPVQVTAATRQVFGVCVVNDWSARDIQAWEYVPLGPFLGKSFATSVSPWIVPWSELAGAQVEPPAPQVELSDYLTPAGPSLDLELEVRINGQVVARPPFRAMSWTPAQMIAHLTANGATVRPGDLIASGTVSGPEVDQLGSLLELTLNGTRPITLADGTERGFLADGDEVAISATALMADGGRCELGEVVGSVGPVTGASHV